MITDDLRAITAALPIEQCGPVEVIAFKHQQRDLFRALLITTDLWDPVRHDVGEVKARAGVRGMCGVYGDIGSYLPMQIMCASSIEFMDRKLIAFQGIVLITDASRPKAAELLQELTRSAAEFFCKAIRAKYSDKEIQMRTKAWT